MKLTQAQSYEIGKFSTIVSESLSHKNYFTGANES